MEDVIEVIRAEVKKLADAWRSRFGHELVNGSNPDRLSRFSPRASYQSLDDRRLPFVAETPLTWGALAAADEAAVCRVIANAVARCPYDAGPPLAERPAERERLTAEMEALKATRVLLVDEYLAHPDPTGHTLYHLPEEEAKRREAAEADKRSGAASRRELEAKVNRRAPQHIQSPYLTSGDAERQALKDAVQVRWP